MKSGGVIREVSACHAFENTATSNFENKRVYPILLWLNVIGRGLNKSTLENWLNL